MVRPTPREYTVCVDMQLMPDCFSHFRAIALHQIREESFTMSKSLYCSLTCLMVAGLLAVAAAQQGDSTMGSMDQASPAKLSAADKKFIKEAAEGGMAEVELGQLAVQKASSDDVKQFGQRMVDDHSKANDK